jgi:hypothetical protein
MKSSIPAVLAALAALCALCGCQVQAVKEARASFGIAGVFKIQKSVTNVKSEEGKTTLGDTDTKVQVLLFEWESSARGVVLAKEPPK